MNVDAHEASMEGKKRERDSVKKHQPLFLRGKLFFFVVNIWRLCCDFSVRILWSLLFSSSWWRNSCPMNGPDDNLAHSRLPNGLSPGLACVFGLSVWQQHEHTAIILPLSQNLILGLKFFTPFMLTRDSACSTSHDVLKLLHHTGRYTPVAFVGKDGQTVKHCSCKANVILKT